MEGGTSVPVVKKEKTERIEPATDIKSIRGMVESQEVLGYLC